MKAKKSNNNIIKIIQIDLCEKKSYQSEYDGTFVLLNHFNAKEERNGKSTSRNAD